MKNLQLIFAFYFFNYFKSLIFMGPTGHRIVGEIAQMELNPKTLTKVKELWITRVLRKSQPGPMR